MPGSIADNPVWRDIRHWSPDRLLLLASGLALTCAMALLLIARPAPVEQAELRLYDFMQGARRLPPQSPVPVLVGIDETSLAAYGQWPWPRYRLAMLVERLHQLGANGVILDILMPEPDRSSPEVIRDERLRDGIEPAGTPIAGAMDSNTQRLATAMTQAKTTLAYQLDFATPRGTRAPQPVPSLPEGVALTSAPGSTQGWPMPGNIIRSLPILTAAASAEGFTNTVRDMDGTLRRTPLLLTLDGQTLPSLSLAAMLLNSSERVLRLVKTDKETHLEWGETKIPLDATGNMLLDYRSERQPFPYYSARTILDGKTQADSLRGKIVLVGPWAAGLRDAHLTPSGRWMNGLEVHATLIDNVLSGTFIARPGWARGAELLAVLLLGTLTSLALSLTGFRSSLAAVLFGSIGCYWGAQQLLITGGLTLSPLLPMLTPIVISTVLSLLKYGIEARKVQQGLQDLAQAQEQIIFSMSVLSETRDEETGLHILRTQRYVEILARQLATTKQYAQLSESSIQLLAKSAPLHDIGKIGIPDAILRKQGKLSAEEYAIMQSHPLIGAQALARVADGNSHPEKNALLDYARQMSESHHERWDGAGYPHGLKGAAIPLAGRLMALADVYDALVSRRVYKRAYSHEETRQYILDHSGTHFDPDVVVAFLVRDEEFNRVAQQLAEESDMQTPNLAQAETA